MWKETILKKKSLKESINIENFKKFNKKAFNSLIPFQGIFYVKLKVLIN